MNWMLSTFFVLNTAHVISPMVVAWGHKGFAHTVAQARWVKFIMIPAVILTVTSLLGLTVAKQFPVNEVSFGIRITDLADYSRPFVWLFPIYTFWNLYHFGAQNFGLVSLYRRGWASRVQRHWWKVAIVGLTIIGMKMPKIASLPQYIGLTIVMLFAFSHSLGAIGLSSYVLGKYLRCSPWLIAAGFLMVGSCLFWLLFGLPWAPVVTMTAIGLRLGLGFVHFLYDRWVWRFSDPQVRATIGQDLFHRREGPPEANYGVAR